MFNIEAIILVFVVVAVIILVFWIKSLEEEYKGSFESLSDQQQDYYELMGQLAKMSYYFFQFVSRSITECLNF